MIATIILAIAAIVSPLSPIDTAETARVAIAAQETPPPPHFAAGIAWSVEVILDNGDNGRAWTCEPHDAGIVELPENFTTLDIATLAALASDPDNDTAETCYAGSFDGAYVTGP